jgi:hypothetical protein
MSSEFQFCKQSLFQRRNHFYVRLNPESFLPFFDARKLGSENSTLPIRSMNPAIRFIPKVHSRYKENDACLFTQLYLMNIRSPVRGSQVAQVHRLVAESKVGFFEKRFNRIGALQVPFLRNAYVGGAHGCQYHSHENYSLFLGSHEFSLNFISLSFVLFSSVPSRTILEKK